jgi:beta-lactamase superfamily II metal-dependent hydrolase
MYRVGFGDFFLLSLSKDGTTKHILVDCGVHAANLGTIGTAIKQLAIDTGNQLALVIMTHHHADHISGFAIGKADFKQFNVEAVWMPWFEDPTNAKATAFRASLTAVATHLQLQFGAARRDDQFSRMAENILGAAGSSNDVAMDTLRNGFANKADPVYYKAGDPAKLPPSLVALGLTAKIVGPPGPNQLDLVAQMDNNKYQYLGEDTDQNAPPARIDNAYHAKEKEYPRAAFELFTAGQIIRQISMAQPDVLAAQAQKADNTVNNQSLVVHFTFGGKTMLFAGDAQWGNWDNFLFDGANVDETTQLTKSTKDLLGNLDFYKVGHHGSRNATPKPALAGMKDGVVAMCSTQPGAYGSAPDDKKGKSDTRVPQPPLLDALNAKTKLRLARSDQVLVPGVKLDQKDIKQRTDVEDDLPSVFKKNDELGYIDFNM